MDQLPFDPADPKAALAQLPRSAAVFALYGAEAHAEPYIGRTPNLRARLERLLQPSPKHPRRLQLAGRVRRIAYRLTGSGFESLLAQFSLLEEIYGPKTLDRMHLGAPAFIRFLGSNAYPRITVTNRVSYRPGQREADWAYGPFQSRAAAERFADEALKLFLLRRCTDDLDPNPAHPGCVYSEMKMCLAPCYQGCTDQRYSEESTAVEEFLSTRGESRLVPLRTQREQASADLEFEVAAALHAQVQRIEAVRALAPEIVRPMSQLRAIILQASALPGEVAVFLYEGGILRGPQAFSTIGMRIQNEQSGSTSLFAQPMAIEPIPEQPGPIHNVSSQAVVQPASSFEVQDPQAEARYGTNSVNRPARSDEAQDAEAEVCQGTTSVVPKKLSKEVRALAPDGPVPARLPRGLLETRFESVLAALAEPVGPTSPTQRQGHLALLKRWYYRPEIRRTGEIFFPDAEGNWAVKPILRGIGRVAAKSLQIAPLV